VIRGGGRFQLEAGLQVITTCLLVGTTWLLGDSLTVDVALWLYCLLQVPLMLASVALTRRARTSHQPGTPSTRLAFLRTTASFNIIGSLAAVYLRLDVLTLGLLATSAVVGQYSAAAQMFQGITSVAAAASVVLLQRLVVGHPTHFRSSARTFTLQYAAVGVLGAMVTMALAEFMPAIYGPGFEPSVTVIRILAIALPASFACYAAGQALVALDLQRHVAINFAGMLGFAVILFPLAASAGGMNGLALAVVAITYASVAYQTVVFGRATRDRA
jgi:O-antigen/teichoic acid export membrane protein